MMAIISTSFKSREDLTFNIVLSMLCLFIILCVANSV